jgi:ABC-2 type transport system permease protein
VSGLHGLGLVAGRELREGLRRKSSWVVIAILFVGSSAALVVPDLVGDDGRTRYDVALVGATPQLEAAIEAAERTLDADIDLDSTRTAADVPRAVDEGDVDVGVLAGADPTIVVRADEHDRLVGAIQQALALHELTERLETAGLSPQAVADALATPAARIQEVAADDAERRLGSFIVSLVLYMLLFSLMMMVANATAVEKSNRISEVLLAIVRPGALLFGKVLGVAALGLLTLGAGIVPVLAKLAVGGDLPAGLGPAVAAASAWFVLGLLLYLTLAGALGALVERPEEAGNVVSPLILVLVGTFVLVQGGADTSLGAVLAYVPFTSPIIEPARLAVGASSPVEVVGSLVAGAVAVAAVVRLGSTIYARAVVRTGRRLKVTEVLRRTQA